MIFYPYLCCHMMEKLSPISGNTVKMSIGSIQKGNNMKKLLMILASVLFLSLFLYAEKISVAWENLNHKVLAVKTVTEDELSNILVDKIQTEDISLPFYDEQQVTFDKVSNTIFITQNISNDIWEGKLKAGEGKILFLQDTFFKDKTEAIRNNHVFTLYCIQAEKYMVYSVVFTGMPVMSIETKEVETGKGQVTILDQYHTNSKFSVAECLYSIRGGTSRPYEKSSYKLTLTNSQLSLLGMRKDDDWILNALYDDAGLIHNKISYDVWQQIALSNNVKNDEGTTMEYVELFIDNEYLGVYGLTERIDKKELSLGSKDILYKCRAYRIPEEHNYSNEITDDMEPIFILKYPNEFSDEEWQPLKDWVNYFCKEQFKQYEEGAKLLSMENAIDYNLYCLLICGSDNTRKNIYFVAEYQSDGTYIFKKVPWDMNATWGNPWISDEECNHTMYDPDAVRDVDTWCTDLSTLYFYDETGTAELLQNRWKELRKEIVTGDNISKMLDAEFEYLEDTGAYTRNYERWPNGAEFWKNEYIYEYVEARIEFLDQYFEQLYMDSITDSIYDGVDYSAEFDARYYWEKNKETLETLFPYDKKLLLEHYALYGKQFGLVAKRAVN